ncbi:hypothetical protein ACH5RR_025586 [Cinchona calisaya]|uniref:GAG-pre-integrase domain-containing protein n=1 Tax=Cinchona calisaya TaxID=153742 RepID=A0ABD2Z165_9GENT
MANSTLSSSVTVTIDSRPLNPSLLLACSNSAPISAISSHNLYPIVSSHIVPKSSTLVASAVPADVWHARLGYPHSQVLSHLQFNALPKLDPPSQSCIFLGPSAPSSSSYEFVSAPLMHVSFQSMLNSFAFLFTHHDHELPNFVSSHSHTSSPSDLPPHSVTTTPPLSLGTSFPDDTHSPVGSLPPLNSSTNVSTSLLSSNTQTTS